MIRKGRAFKGNGTYRTYGSYRSTSRQPLRDTVRIGGAPTLSFWSHSAGGSGAVMILSLSHLGASFHSMG